MSSSAPILYGQVAVGAPGSGKTTFCNGMQQYLRLLGRNAWVINLDPANDDELEYETLWNVTQNVIHLHGVMKDFELGPNGGLLYCLEYLNAHADEWIPSLRKAIEEQPTPTYLLLDLPGQSEVYTHGTSVSQLLSKLAKQLNLRLTVVQLVDSTQCRQATSFLSSTLLGLATMIRLEFPTINVLSKFDLIVSSEEELAFSMDYFLDCHDLERLVDYLDEGGSAGSDSIDIGDDPEYQAARERIRQSIFWRKHHKLYSALAEVVEDYGLFSFHPLDISNATSVGQVVQKIDQANGYIFVPSSSSNKVEDMFSVAIQERENRFESIAEIQERLHRGGQQSSSITR
jgi:GTPase SAR1 family protein